MIWIFSLKRKMLCDEDPVVSALIKSDENLLLHGPGGTGKTYLLKMIARSFAISGYTHSEWWCAAPTGVAALNLHLLDSETVEGVPKPARTIHSWLGIGLGHGTFEELLNCARQFRKTKNRILFTKVLIIDEISMVGQRLFEILEYITRKIKGVEKPFGGIKLIVSGDFMQLPPVNDKWCFESDVWKSANFKTFLMNKPQRFVDTEHFGMLGEIRMGKITRATFEKLNSRHKSYLDLEHTRITARTANGIPLKPDDEGKEGAEGKVAGAPVDSGTCDIIPTKVYSKKCDVQKNNQLQMDLLPLPDFVFKAVDLAVTNKNSERPVLLTSHVKDLESQAPATIVLRKGAQVMLLVNCDVEGGLVNGSRGVVVDFIDIPASGTRPAEIHVLVKFINGREKIISNARFELPVNDGPTVGKCIRTQIPLMPAWSVTVHKIQGCTLDYAVCDIGPSIFSPGQAYVALSRVRSITGLYLSDFDIKSIKISKKARDFVMRIESGAVNARIKKEKDEDKTT